MHSTSPHRSLTLARTVFTKDQLFLPPEPQVALAGRSNVGKSTLINTLAGTKKLAKTSQTPGKTRSLNFYLVEPPGYYLVDLPGYGYARASKTDRQKWAGLINIYFAKADALRGLVVLLDSRLPPQDLDLDLIAYAKDRGLPLMAVLTKADKIKQAAMAKQQKMWREILGGVTPLPFSGKTGRGRDAFFKQVEMLMGDALPVHTPVQADEGGADHGPEE
jgi:GTP-binding protein